MGQFLEYVKMALDNIRANKGRSFLTMLGIIIGITSVVTIVSIGNGLKADVIDATNQQTNTVTVQVNTGYYISCIEEIYKKYVAIARAENPGMFLEKRYTPHTMRHTTATHMLEAGIPMMAIKNFLGHSSISTTERYAELSQGTVNRHIRDWNEKWFSQQKESSVKRKKENQLPDFLK